MSVAVVMPARLESSRLRHKLLLSRTGRTVLEHTIARALEARARSSGLIRTVLVACDDERLVDAAKQGGAEAVLTRKDHQSGTDRIAEAAERMPDDIIVNLQADEPEMDPDSILLVARLLAEAPAELSMATLAVPIVDEDIWKKPSVVKVVTDHAGMALYFSRAPIPFARGEAEAASRDTVCDDAGKPIPVYGLHHLGIYAYRRTFLLAYSSLPPSRLEKLERLEQLRALEAGHGIRVGVVGACPPGIDTEEEYEAFVSRWKASADSAG